ncbi:NAD(P)/FAD-dependent oxidoreductase [uncultured Bradyrhizobium sp.]|uniref:NAD(P)/FAD-dependent oxidoreductase n=1 Tax=uncultured Bradyrhizobium sp. TaxID=199684 RepID=UPI0035CB9D07
MSRTLTVAIVGGGIAGLCTAWAFTKLGHSVTLFEQASSIPNELSASGDQHRILRHAYGERDGYARMMPEADAAWAELWKDIGAEHFVPTGILILSQRTGDGGDILRLGLDRMGQKYRTLEPEVASGLYPFLSKGLFRYALMFGGGVLMCREIARDMVSWLVRNGARVVTNTRVRGIATDKGELDILGLGTYAYDRVVVAAGAWTSRLLPHLSSILLNYRNVVLYLEPPRRLNAAWASAPVIAETGGWLEGYILPPVRGTKLKVGIGSYRAPSAGPDDCFSTSWEEGERLMSMISPALHGAAEYRIIGTRTCSYVFTKDGHFYAGRFGKVTVISACSGHGYKFGAVAGLRLAQCVENDNHDGFNRWLRTEA